jgi:hypothetical protein
MIELDDQRCEFCQVKYQGTSLLIIDLFKEDICKTSSWVLAKFIWLSILLWTYK